MTVGATGTTFENRQERLQFKPEDLTVTLEREKENKFDSNAIQIVVHIKPLVTHGLSNMRLYLKKLYAYLYETGRSEDNHSLLFSFTVNREKKVFPVLPKPDIAKVLEAIERTGVKWKRDYAIMMLAVFLGQRPGADR